MTPDFFARPTLQVARDLLGRTLACGAAAGRILEVEAYLDDDPALLGWRARFGPDGRVLPEGRARALFGPPGTPLVYGVQGGNRLLNVITEPAGRAGAVLIRAVAPLAGIEGRADGPARLVRALGIRDGRRVTFERGAPVPDEVVERLTRIGLSHGQDRPHRFRVRRRGPAG